MENILRLIFGPKILIEEKEIKDIFAKCYKITRDLGFEYKTKKRDFDNFQYKNKIIDICHFNDFADVSFMKDYTSGKHVVIYHNNKLVFDVSVDKRNQIKAKCFERREDWLNYLKVLEKRVDQNTLAREICHKAYAVVEDMWEKKKASSSGFGTSSWSFAFEQGNLKINLTRYDKRISLAPIIYYNGEKVFDAVYYYPDKPFSTNTRCNLYKRGHWEKLIDDLYNATAYAKKKSKL